MNPTPKKAAHARFAPLFTLAITHQYVNGGLYDSYAMTPLGATVALLRQQGWMVAHSANRFILYAEVAHDAATSPQPAAEAEATAAAPEPEVFFLIEFRDTDFPRYTDLPMRLGCVLSARPNITSAHDPQDAPEALSLELVDITEAACPFPAATLASLKHRPAGIVLALSTRQLRDRQAAGGGPHAATDAGYIARLDLHSRSTIWRYDIFHQGVDAAHRYEIQPAAPGAGLPAFHRVKGIVAPGGETSLAFESTTPIPMAALPGQRFRLLRDQKPLIAVLPVPDLETALTNGASGPCSNLLIYL